MRNFTLLILMLLIYSKNALSQVQELSISKADSLKLDITWNEFKKAVLLNEQTKILELSMDSIYCPICLSMKQSEKNGGYTIPVKKFIKHLNKVFDEHVWKAINTKSYTIIKS